MRYISVFAVASILGSELTTALEMRSPANDIARSFKLPVKICQPEFATVKQREWRQIENLMAKSEKLIAEFS